MAAAAGTIKANAVGAGKRQVPTPADVPRGQHKAAAGFSVAQQPTFRPINGRAAPGPFFTIHVGCSRQE
ncbi:MAG TPA: hypothetical protein VES94_04675 [Burkholderiales bacterium]|nr:hypothetical protein [Burkholderiales bacterium]